MLNLDDRGLAHDLQKAAIRWNNRATATAANEREN